MKRGIIATAVITFICLGAGAAFCEDFIKKEDLIKKNDTLSLQRCLEIALKQNPGLGASRAAVEVSGSKVDEAKSNYYPQVSLSSGYARKSAPAATGSANGASPGTIDAYNASASLKQNIFDFGKTSAQVDIQRLNLESSRKDLENTQSQTVFNVKQAYYKTLQAKRSLDLAVSTVKQFEDHLVQAKGFYEAGTRSRIDVTKAAVDKSNAELGRIQAANALKIALARLSNAMGLTQAPEYAIEDNLSFVKYNIAFEDALERAYKNRPDLKSVSARMRSAERGIDLAKKGHYPQLSGDAAYNWSGRDFPLDKSWNVGATVTIPIFSGFLTKYQIEESRASLNAARANADSIKQSIFLDVQQAYLNLTEAAERIPAAELVVKQADENLELANQRYINGIGSPLEITDAEVLAINAKNAYNQALYDYKIAEASVEKAMGAK